APKRVDAFILEHETSDWDVIHDVRLNNLSHIFRLHLAVPHCFRIDDHRWPMLTLVEASGFVGAYGTFETALGDRRLEELRQVASGSFGAAAASAARLALVDTDEDMLSEFGHMGIVSIARLCCWTRRLIPHLAKRLKTNSFCGHQDQVLRLRNRAGVPK